MTTIIQKKKIGKAGWALVLIFLILIIGIVILGIMGVLDLSPVGNGIMGFFMWASSDIVNACLVLIGLPIAGAFLYYFVQRYFIGQKVVTTAGVGSGGYSPVPTYPTSNPQQQDTETKIS